MSQKFKKGKVVRVLEVKEDELLGKVISVSSKEVEVDVGDFESLEVEQHNIQTFKLNEIVKHKE